MKLLVQSTIIFFGTLFAAAVVAFGEPGHAEPQAAAFAAKSASAPSTGAAYSAALQFAAGNAEAAAR